MIAIVLITLAFLAWLTYEWIKAEQFFEKGEPSKSYGYHFALKIAGAIIAYALIGHLFFDWSVNAFLLFVVLACVVAGVMIYKISELGPQPLPPAPPPAPPPPSNIEEKIEELLKQNKR